MDQSSALKGGCKLSLGFVLTLPRADLKLYDPVKNQSFVAPLLAAWNKETAKQ